MAISATHMHVDCISARSGCSSPALSFSRYVSGSNSAFSNRGRSVRGEKRGSLVVQIAASREKKQRDINMLKGMLSNDDTLLVATSLVLREWCSRSQQEGLSARVIP